MSNATARGRSFAVRFNPVSAAVATAVGSIAAMPAVAQEGEVEVTGDFFEEIVVTSTRRQTAAQDVPYNVSAFTGETLERQRIDSLAEFARWVPGLTLTDQGQRFSSLLTVRGLNASQLGAPESTLGNGSGDTVATYLGEVPLYIDLKPYDLDRVEVLIGPQGTLYGAGTLAGAVRYIPKKPDPTQWSLDTHANLNAKAHSEDFGYEVDAVLNMPLIQDKLALRVLVGYFEDAGFVDYKWLVQEAGVSNPEPPAGQAAQNLTQRKDVDDVETVSFRASLLWNMTDAAEWTYNYYYQNKDAGGRTITHQDSFGTADYEAAHRFLEPLERENQLHSLVLDWDFGPINWVSAAGYSEWTRDGQRDQTDLLLNFEYGYETFPSFAAFTAEDTDAEETLTLESRVVSNFDAPVNFIVGGFYSDQETDFDVSREFAPGYPEYGCANGLIINCPPPLPFGDLEFIQFDEDKTEEIALFGELTWQITDRWQVTGGLRWFDYEVTTSSVATAPFFDPGFTNEDELRATKETVKVSEDDVIFKFNTSVDLDGWINAMDSGTAYFTFSQGYRQGAGNFVEACEDPLPPGQNVCALPNEQSYGTDTTDNYELGLKSTWFDNRLTFNTALFYILWQDTQLETITVNGALPITSNVGETENYGVELALRGQITDQLAIYATYAYTKAELNKDAPGAIGCRFGFACDLEDGVADGLANAFAGDRLPGTPEHQGGVFVNYSTPFLGTSTLDLDYGFTSISDVYTKLGNRGSGEALGGFTVHNVSATVTEDAWSASLYIDNLTDKFARTGVRGDTDFIDTVGLFQLRRYYHNIIQPRTVGLDFRYRFDF